MAQKPERKVLRVGLMKKGKVLEERLLLQRESVTIGRSERCTFTFEIEGLPKVYPLFKVNKDGAYVLQFTERMIGKVSLGDQLLDFPSIIEAGLSTLDERGKLHTVTLQNNERGKVEIGDKTLLFQFIPLPPPKIKAGVPAAFQKSFINSLDWNFLNILIGVTLFQVSSISFITTRDYPPATKNFAEISNRFMNIMKPEKKPPPPPEDDKKKPEEKPEDDKRVAEKSEEKDLPPPDTKENKEKRRKILTERVQKKTVLQFLAVGDGSNPSGLVGELSGEAARVSMDEAFQGVGLVAANSSNNTRRRAAGDASGKTIDVDESKLKGKGRKRVRTGRKRERSPKGSLKLSKPSEAIGTGALSSDRIQRTVRRRQGALKSCYESELKKDPSLSGTIKVRWTIQPSGRVSSAQVIQNTMGSSSVGRCIASQIKRWRFDKPSGGDVTIAYPFYFKPSS